MRDSLTAAIVERIAKEENVAPIDLDYALHQYIDTDAINQLADSETNWTLTFEVPGHTVTVTHEGGIYVDEGE